MQNIRAERTNSEISKALSFILKNKVNDPRLREFITITYVNVSADFRYCKVGVSVYTGDSKQVISCLQKSKGFIKRELMQMVRLPFTPELTFIIDNGAKHSEDINKILESLDIPEENLEEDNDD